MCLIDAPEMRKPVAGVDGCPGGWFVAMDTDDGGIATRLYPSLEELVGELQDYTLLVDIPMGLTPDAPRRLDAALRRWSYNPSSVFTTPCREAVYAEDYEEANEINQQRYDMGVSQQAFAICRKIREMDALLRNGSGLSGRAFESHPELCFQIIKSGPFTLHPKRTPEGWQQREELLEPLLPGSLEAYDDAMDGFPHTQVARDDILDALALLLTARGPNCLLRCKQDHDPRIPDFTISVVLPEQARTG